MMNRNLLCGHGTIVRMAQVLVWICGGALIVMSVVITVEALMRKFLSHSFGGVDEITAYVFAVTTTFAFPFAILQRANIRIDILRNLFGVRVRLLLDVMAWAAFTLVFALIAYRACALALQSYAEGARSITPLRSYLAIPQGAWAAGLVASVLASLSLALRAVALWRSGRAAAAAALLSPSDEVAQELSHIAPASGAPSDARLSGDMS
ncbi:TRAP transporter small permease subunit [Antarcticimicrobium luteum]|uniref:TRAP transporter small permease protein n=1 Tax=Antarcticimicrobium luteum TaxID=2547397 RepID=A0A4V3AS07_9RHOB|nr:TRAP transporter small permease [Antarcticimicrobium luteum]TDK48677.1 TRAP transporter small permease [Antarcticimicrobium luteum]